ncbi:MAG: biotin/lipoate A/B protein ligase family protein [bacterium]
MKSKREKNWRFINSGAADGRFNMAVDEALARYCDPQIPVLRIYRWQPFTISIGYHQKFEDIDLEKCRKDGVDVVRRPTGGRAIFHAHEVTYSAIIPSRSVWYQETTLAVYNQISSALAQGLCHLGLLVTLERIQDFSPGFTQYKERFACFSTSAKYEIHFRGKKLVGSAQRRFKNAVLQHGSILLGEDHLRLLDYLSSNGNGVVRQAQEQLQQRTVCIENILKHKVDNEEVAAVLKLGFEEYFDIALQPDQLSLQELKRINDLKPKYTDIF